MLKIKDNVDLKELEKFGFDRFKYSPDTGEKVRLEHKESNWGRTYISLPDKVLISGCTNDERAEIYYKDQLSIIYDLIEAGLVEKDND